MYSELLEEIKNGAVFTESLQGMMDGFSINTLILLCMMIFTIVGAVDKIRGNTSGYGEKFDEAFHTMGPLGIAMVGIITMVPIIELTLEPLIAPVYSFFGASPAMFAGTVLPIDSGAYPLAMQMAGDDKAIGNFSGVILGGTFGMIITGLVPLALTILRKEDQPFFAAGVLVALITIPLGCVAGGLVMNMTPFKMDFGRIMINLVPVIIVSVLIALGLICKPQAVMNGFSAFGRAFGVLLTISTALAIIQFVTGLRLPLFRLMVEAPASGGQSPLMESIYVVGTIALMLTGAFPMVHWVTRTFQKPLAAMGERLGMNEIGSAGMFAGLANLIPTLNMTKDMNDKAKFLNIAFGVSASFVLGDHLGFTASMNQDMIFPMIVGKLVAGSTALLLAHRLSPFLLPWITKSGNGQPAGDSRSKDL